MISLGTQEDRYIVRIEDDGKGYVPSQRAKGIGLIGIEERVTEMDGILELKSAPGAGTKIFVSIPLHTVPESQERAAAAAPQPNENPIG